MAVKSNFNIKTNLRYIFSNIHQSNFRVPKKMTRTVTDFCNKRIPNLSQMIMCQETAYLLISTRYNKRLHIFATLLKLNCTLL